MAFDIGSVLELLLDRAPLGIAVRENCTKITRHITLGDEGRCECLHERIKKVSMQDIADYVGVSKNTVSLALNDKSGVSDKRRREILEAAAQLNYGGVNLATRELTTNILVLAPSYVASDQQFYPEIIWEVEKCARLHELNTILTVVTTEMQQSLTPPTVLVNNTAIQGIIVLGIIPSEYLAKLLTVQQRVIYLDTYDVNTPCHSVVTDNLRGAIEAVHYVLGLGHRDVGFVGPFKKTSSFFERWLGYQYAMAESDFAIHPDHCILDASGMNIDEQELEAALTAMPELPTAFFCANDVMATCLIHVLTAMGISVPEQVSVIGFDDTDTAESVLPKLTTVRVRRDLLAQEAMNLLMSPEWRRTDPIKVAVIPHLLVRDSVAPYSEGTIVQSQEPLTRTD